MDGNLNVGKGDGGPAFPAPAGVQHITSQGMTLRDYFAAAALTGLLASPKNITNDQDCAVDCYWFADAMLAERARKEAQP